MNFDPEILINGYLDDQLSEAEQQALNDWLKQDQGHARRFALALMQHDRLRDRFRPSEALNETGLRSAEGKPTAAQLRRYGAIAAAAAGVLIAGLILFQGVSDRRVNAAEAQLDRLIEAAGKPGDRTFRITTLDPGDVRIPEARTNQGQPRPTIDGALLHVRGEGQYVLVRQQSDSSKFVTGSNGKGSWSIRPDGPVRIDTDPTRFRGAVPGEQQGLPFLDLKSALGRLREAYELELVASPSGPRLIARKKSNAYRGPRSVEVEFDERTGLLRRMRMDGMPQAQGGPRSIALELLDQNDLGPDFFEHETHHDADRRVIRESS